MGESMKFKVIISSFVIALILVGVAFRYYNVNQNLLNGGIEKTSFIREKELIHGPNIDFKIMNLKKVEENSKIKVSLTLEATSKGQNNFAFHKNNPYFIENIFLETPYSQPSSVSLDNNREAIKSAINNFAKGKTITVPLLFETSKQEWKNSESKPKITFLIPHHNKYIRYSVVLQSFV